MPTKTTAAHMLNTYNYIRIWFSVERRERSQFETFHSFTFPFSLNFLSPNRLLYCDFETSMHNRGIINQSFVLQLAAKTIQPQPPTMESWLLDVKAVRIPRPKFGANDSSPPPPSRPYYEPPRDYAIEQRSPHEAIRQQS